MEAKKAVELQQKLRNRVKLAPLKRELKIIAGCDVSLNLFGKDLYAGVIVLSFPKLTVLEEATVKIKTDFPYIPGLLSFREAPGILKCLEKLSRKPDVLIADGQGIAHPRRLGLASHIGVLSGIPTIGCAKSMLYGKVHLPDVVGETREITDPKNGEIIGEALLTKARSKPLIISPGHLVTLQDSVQIVRACVRGYRLPEPTRLAHLLVNARRLRDH